MVQSIRKRKISEENLLKWSTVPASIDPSLHLPPKNVFIATDFALRRESTKGGMIIMEV